MNKFTVYTTDRIFYGDEYIQDEQRIARIIKKHLSHLGDITIYYEIRNENLSWWKRLLRSLGSGY